MVSEVGFFKQCPKRGFQTVSEAGFSNCVRIGYCKCQKWVCQILPELKFSNGV